MTRWSNAASRPRTAFRRFRAACSTASLAALCLAAAPARAGDYHLGPTDRVHVKVVEFSSNTLTPNEWAVLTGDYAVDTGGNLMLPIIGAIHASGLTTADLNAAVVEAIRKTIGFDDNQKSGTSITASIEMVEYRPFYIVGGVQKPGAYPFRPDLTVLQAVSIAGGSPTVGEQNGWAVARDGVNAQGDLDTVNSQLISLLARQARLQAEQANAGSFDIPASSVSPPLDLNKPADVATLQKIKDEEQAIFTSRANDVRRQVESLDRQKTLLQDQVQSLSAQVNNQKKQADLIARDLSSVSALVERGLSIVSRRLTLERALADTEGRTLEFQTTMIQVSQDLNKSERERASILDKRQNDIAVELRDTQTEIDDVRKKKATAEGLLMKLAMTSPLAAQSSAATQIQQIYSIVRRNEKGQSVEEPNVPEDTPINPGDTVKVTFQGPPQAAIPVTGGAEPEDDEPLTR